LVKKIIVVSSVQLLQQMTKKTDLIFSVLSYSLSLTFSSRSYSVF